MDDNKKVLARQLVKSASIDGFEKALRAIQKDARGCYPLWEGKSATLLESADGFTAYGFELIEEALSDGGKALTVRLLFVGDV